MLFNLTIAKLSGLTNGNFFRRSVSIPTPKNIFSIVYKEQVICDALLILFGIKTLRECWIPFDRWLYYITFSNQVCGVSAWKLFSLNDSTETKKHYKH